MNNTIHFHTDYTSSGLKSYTKVCMELPDGGLICVIRNNSTGDIQRQKYDAGKWNRRNIVGVRVKGHCSGCVELSNEFGNLTNKNKDDLLHCIGQLYGAFSLYRKSHPSFTCEDANETRKEIQKVADYFASLINGQNPQLNESSVPVPDKGTWIPIDLSSVSGNDVNEIISQVMQKGNPEFGIFYNGKKYRIAIEERGSVLQQWSESFQVSVPTPAVPSNANPPVFTLRKSVQMAQIIDDTNLIEFVKGCYYKIVANNGDYLRVLTDDGEERMLNKSRVNLCEVYTEPPEA